MHQNSSPDPRLRSCRLWRCSILYGLIVPDAEAQTVGMERRHERRTGRHERREARRTGRTERLEERHN